MSAKVIQYKPKDIIFEEGDQSKNLYFIKSGVIRIFKRKAEGNIELETVRNGQVLGEMAFFDGQPRSASAEALTTCEVIEMSREALDEALSKFPDWLVSLTKTVSGRLRNANNRIRILESLSVEYGVDQHGNRSKDYTFINTPELLRFCTALLAVASRYGKNATTDGIEFNPALLEKFATQILQVSGSKVISMIEVFKSVEILKGELFLTDIKFLDQLIQYLNDQNLLEHTKKQTLSDIGFKALSALIQSRSTAAPLSDSMIRVNIAPALKGTSVQLNQLQELVDQQFAKNVALNSATEILIDFDGSKIMFLYRTFWLLQEIKKLNEEKRRG